VLAALATTPFLRVEAGKFALTELGQRFLLGDSAIRYLMGILEWDWLSRLAPFLREGRAIDFHAHLSRDQWQIYQEMQYFRTKAIAPLWSEALPIPETARDLLDLAGGHGCFAAHLCRRHPQLRAVVFDLPGAIDSSERVFSEEARGLEQRLTRQAGDALQTDLGTDRYDVITVLMLMHVLTEEQNREILARCARALRPGGLLVLVDRITNPELDGQLDCFYYLVLGLGCASTAYSFEQLETWERAAGLEPFHRVTFETGMGDGLLLARKPAAA
jgi:SAM-dependent methyltransferase